ncbi:unnamed protein product [Tilletia caries]|nr:unnamed protein product [Tilletia caries]
MTRAGPSSRGTGNSRFADTNRFEELYDEEGEDEAEAGSSDLNNKVAGSSSSVNVSATYGKDEGTSARLRTAPATEVQGVDEGEGSGVSDSEQYGRQTPPHGRRRGQGKSSQRNSGRGRGEKRGAGVEGLNAWHEDEHGSEVEEDDGDGRKEGPDLSYAHQYGYDSASSDSDDAPANSNPDVNQVDQEIDLDALPPELRARTASLLAEAQAADGLSPSAELAFDTVIWTIPLVFVYVLLDVLVRQQYAQPVYLMGELRRVGTRGPFLAFLAYYSLKHRESPWLRYGFFGLSLATGGGFLYVTAKTQLQTACRGQQKPTKYYAVADGYDRGVYNNWSDAKAATNGYSNNCHQSFRSPQEASQFVQQGGAYSKQDWAQSQGGQSSNGYKPK